jgi:hypothetical protein
MPAMIPSSGSAAKINELAFENDLLEANEVQPSNHFARGGIGRDWTKGPRTTPQWKSANNFREHYILDLLFSS